MRGFSSRTSSWQTFSASGSLVKVLLQDELSGDRIDSLLLDAAQAALRFDRGEALVDARHRQAEGAFQPPCEFLDLLGERVLALLANRQTDDQTCRMPLFHQRIDFFELRNRLKRMNRFQFRLSDCNSNTLETEVEGEDGALRHAPPNPADVRSRGQAAPSPPADALLPAFRR